MYVGFSCGNALLVAVGALLLTACALRASHHLHETLLRRVVRSPMSFFDSTATGIIMNRMLQDIQNVDQYVPNSILDLSTKILTMVAQLALILAFAYWVLLALPVLLPLYVAVLHRVRPAARDTRRIESVAHSPVYTHFGDAIRGIETVAAFGKSARARFFARNEALVGAMSRAKIGNEAVCKWAQALSTQLGCALYFFTGVACVVLNGRGDISASELGLVLLYAGVLQRSVMDFMMQLTVVETQFVSVERVAEYSRLEGEPPDGDFAPPPGWPFAGEIRIQNVSLRYRVFSPPVLRGLALSIAPRSKTALCGRTGCGKSSLFGALCRLYPVCAGQILIDGVNLASLPLVVVRRVVVVITQDVLLLEGTLLSNLVVRAEPGAAADDDAAAWAALSCRAERARCQPVRRAARARARGRLLRGRAPAVRDRARARRGRPNARAALRRADEQCRSRRRRSRARRAPRIRRDGRRDLPPAPARRSLRSGGRDEHGPRCRARRAGGPAARPGEPALPALCPRWTGIGVALERGWGGGYESSSLAPEGSHKASKTLPRGPHVRAHMRACAHMRARAQAPTTPNPSRARSRSIQYE